MKICDVVLNSIWYDPRVNRQIEEYSKDKEIKLVCIGLTDNRYDNEKIKKYKFPINIIKKPEKYNKKLHSIFGKLKREKVINNLISKAIIETKPDIIHANDLDALIPSMMAAKKLKCKVIYDSHEIFIENIGLRDKKIYKKYLEMIEKKLVKKVDLMVCVSNSAADYFVTKYKIKKPLVVTNCSLKQDKSILLTSKSKEFEVLNHGSFYPGRGYDLCATVGKYLKEYPEIKFVIRGLGYYESNIREKIKSSNSEKFVRMDPPVNVEELIPMAAKSHVGVAITENICLNFKLSVSNKIFEYVAAGLPVIMSDIPEHRYLNEKYKFGIIIKENTTKEIVDAAIKLFKDKVLYEEYKNNAIKMAQKLNWENEFNKLIEFEKKILSKNISKTH